jgi:hypothetical protein
MRQHTNSTWWEPTRSNDAYVKEPAMISTPEQYKATQEWVAIFEGNLQRLSAKADAEDPRVLKMEMDACASMIESLREELTEYEAEHHLDLV